MSLILNGDGSIQNLNAGGLPSATVTQATLATPVAGTGPAFRAYASNGQTVSSTIDTKIILNTEVFDTANCFDSTTNYRFTPNVAGYYQINALIGATASSSLSYNYIQIRKNGLVDSFAIYSPYGGTTNYGSISSLLFLNGSTDYVELYVQLSGTGTLSTLSGSNSIILSGSLVRAA